MTSITSTASVDTVTKPAEAAVPMPSRSFTLEFFVGLFTLVTLAALGYLAIGLGDLRIFSSERYTVTAEFDNVAGLKSGASVEIAGVQVGEVASIELSDPFALVTMNIVSSVRIRDDDIASVRTKGIIGDRYIKISRGGSDVLLKPGSRMTETESAVDIEDIIGKIVHSLSSGDDSSDKGRKAEENQAKEGAAE